MIHLRLSAVAPSIMHTLQILGFIPAYPPDCDKGSHLSLCRGAMECLVLVVAAAFVPRQQGSLCKAVFSAG